MNNSAIITDAPNTVRLLSRTTRGLPNLKDRALGMILGLAAGNLLGLPVEGWSRSEIAAQYPQGVTEVDPKERTLPMDDDLAQAAELGEALLHRGDHVQDLRTLPHVPPQEGRRLWKHRPTTPARTFEGNSIIPGQGGPGRTTPGEIHAGG